MQLVVIAPSEALRKRIILDLQLCNLRTKEKIFSSRHLWGPQHTHLHASMDSHTKAVFKLLFSLTELQHLLIARGLTDVKSRPAEALLGQHSSAADVSNGADCVLAS